MKWVLREIPISTARRVFDRKALSRITWTPLSVRLMFLEASDVDISSIAHELTKLGGAGANWVISSIRVGYERQMSLRAPSLDKHSAPSLASTLPDFAHPQSSDRLVPSLCASPSSRCSLRASSRRWLLLRLPIPLPCQPRMVLVLLRTCILSPRVRNSKI